MSTCNQLDLEILGCWPIMPKNLPGHRGKRETQVLRKGRGPLLLNIQDSSCKNITSIWALRTLCDNLFSDFCFIWCFLKKQDLGIFGRGGRTPQRRDLQFDHVTKYRDKLQLSLSCGNIIDVQLSNIQYCLRNISKSKVAVNNLQRDKLLENSISQAPVTTHNIPN